MHIFIGTLQEYGMDYFLTALSFSNNRLNTNRSLETELSIFLMTYWG